MTKWTTKNIPRQNGRLAVVTGTGGLGYEDALALARAGTNVVIAGRNPEKGAHAVAAIKAHVPGAQVRFGQIDLANLASVAAFAKTLAGEQNSLDLLINNAGVMTPPQRRETSDGFELQFGTNYLGHFALNAHLLPLLKKGNARASSPLAVSRHAAVRSTLATCRPSAATSLFRSTASRSWPASCSHSN